MWDEVTRQKGALGSSLRVVNQTKETPDAFVVSLTPRIFSGCQAQAAGVIIGRTNQISHIDCMERIAGDRTQRWASQPKTGRGAIIRVSLAETLAGMQSAGIWKKAVEGRSEYAQWAGLLNWSRPCWNCANNTHAGEKKSFMCYWGGKADIPPSQRLDAFCVIWESGEYCMIRQKQAWQA